MRKINNRIVHLVMCMLIPLIIFGCGAKESETAKQTKRIAKKYNLPSLLEMPEPIQEKIVTRVIRLEEASHIPKKAKKPQIVELVTSQVDYYKRTISAENKATQGVKSREQALASLDYSAMLNLNQQHQDEIKEFIEFQINHMQQPPSTWQSTLDETIQQYAQQEEQERKNIAEKEARLTGAKERRQQEAEKKEQLASAKEKERLKSLQSEQDARSKFSANLFSQVDSIIDVKTANASKRDIENIVVSGAGLLDAQELIQASAWLKLVNQLLNKQYESLPDEREITSAFNTLIYRGNLYIKIHPSKGFTKLWREERERDLYLVEVISHDGTEEPYFEINDPEWEDHPVDKGWFIKKWTPKGETLIVTGGSKADDDIKSFS